MAAQPPSQRHRARPGSVDRPVNSRMYRGTWLLVGFPCSSRPFPSRGRRRCRDRTCRPISTVSPRRRWRRTSRTSSPTGPRASGASSARPGSSERRCRTGSGPNVDRFHAKIPGRGSVQLENVLASRQGRSHDVIVGHRPPRQHRRGTGCERQRLRNGGAARAGPHLRGAAGATATPPSQITRSSSSRPTAAPSEASAPHGSRRTPPTGTASSRRSISTQSRARASAPRFRSRSAPLAVCGARPDGVERILEQTRTEPTSPSLLGATRRSCVPYSLYEQAPFVDQGIAAITLTSAATGRRRHSATRT